MKRKIIIHWPLPTATLIIAVMLSLGYWDNGLQGLYNAGIYALACVTAGIILGYIINLF